MRLCWLGLLVGCGFSNRLNVDARTELDDAGREIRKWDFDTATDFAAAGGETIDMTIDPRGSITPNGYVYGALVGHGLAGMKLWSNTDADWSKLAAITPSAGTGLWTGNDIDVPGDIRFVGIPTDMNMYTVWFEGELWINSGETFKITGNDTAFLYVARDGKTFEKLLHNDSAVITVPASGWYPVRIGWADSDNSGSLDFEVNPGGGFNNLDRTRYRAATSAVRGIARNVYYREMLGGGILGAPPVTSIQETAFHPATVFNPALPGSYTVDPPTLFDWSARWSGQLYATIAGTYQFRVMSSDGNRVRVGNAAPVSIGFIRNSNGTANNMVTADLVVGWNDIIVDFNHVTGPPSFDVQVIASPDPALVLNMPIPKDRLRPVEPRGDRVITRSIDPGSRPTILDDQATTFAELTANIAAHPGEMVTSIEVTARVETGNVTQLLYRLTAPNAVTQTMTMTEVADGNQGGFSIVQGTSNLGAGTPANGAWKLGISDESSSGSTGNSTYDELHITVHTRVGREQVAMRSVWSSPIIENTTNVELVDFVNWVERVPAGATVTVRMRTCSTVICSDGSWVDVAKDMPPTLTPNRYIQMQVEMTSDGTREPEVESINAQYRTAKAR